MKLLSLGSKQIAASDSGRLNHYCHPVHLGHPFLWPVSAMLEQRQTDSTSQLKKKSLKMKKEGMFPVF
jgi:hypothetical protein